MVDHPDDMMQVIVSAEEANAFGALRRIPGVDFGCRPHIFRGEEGRWQMVIHMPHGQLAALDQVPHVQASVLANASTYTRAMQSEIAAATPFRADAVRPGLATGQTLTNYQTVDTIETNIAALAAKFPGTAQLVTLPNKTFEGRTSHVLRIGTRTALNPKGVLLTGCEHGREWGGAEICYCFASDLLTAYQAATGVTYGGQAYGAADIKRIIETMEIFVFPCVNPDGRNYDMVTGSSWRKNRNTSFSNGDPNKVGVDIARNFDFLWDFRKDFDPGIANGVGTYIPPASDNPSSLVFHGTGPASEPETRNIVWLFDTFPQIRLYLDIHSYTGDFLYSWGDAPNQSTNPDMNFSNRSFDGKRGVNNAAVYGEFLSQQEIDVSQQIAFSFTGAVQKVRGTLYDSRQAFFLVPGGGNGGIYPTSGCFDDYARSRHETLGKTFIRPFNLEFGKFKGHEYPNCYAPPWTEMQQIVLEIDAGLMAFCLFDPDPCSILQKNLDDLDANIETLREAIDDHEIPEPRNPKTIAAVEANLHALEKQSVALARQLALCRKETGTS